MWKLKYFITFLIILIKFHSGFVTIGDPKAKLRIDVFLDILQEQSGTTFNNLIESLERSCLKLILNKTVFLKIHLISQSNNHEIALALSNYFNQLEEITSTFEECKTCSLKKFVRLVEYFRKINKNLEKIKNAKNLNEILVNLLNHLDAESINETLSNRRYLNIYQSDTNIFNNVALRAPLVYINSVFIDAAGRYSVDMWNDVFQTNFTDGDLKCENWEDFINKLKYY